MNLAAATPFRRACNLFQRPAWKPLVFPKDGAVTIPAEERVEEETIPGYVAARYYPVRIGEILGRRYQVVGKLGFGVTSTVWLARDLEACRHVALKLYVRAAALGDTLDTELDVYRRIERSPKQHLGRSAVRTLLDSFDVDGPSGRHRCLVHPPLWESMRKIRNRNDVRRLPVGFLAFSLKCLFHGLDLLHEECHVAHTDISETNIMLGADSSVLTQFENEELEQPSPMKTADGSIVYLSRDLGIPKDFGGPVLCDFGAAVPLDDGREHREDVQPDIYRSPEVILDIPWTYSVDIWNVGCMVWDAFEGGHLFTGRDPELHVYRGRAHLAEIIALLGPPPPSLLARANLRSKFFNEEGDFAAGIPLPSPRPLEERETSLLGDANREDRQLFLRFVRKMLLWEPEKRSSARELAEDEWVVKHAGLD